MQTSPQLLSDPTLNKCYSQHPYHLHLKTSYFTHSREKKTYKQNPKMKPTFLTLLLSLMLISATVSLASRPEPNESVQKKTSGGNDDGTGMGGAFGPGDGFNIPGLGPVIGGGYGSGYGGPSGGRSKSGTVRNSVVCKEKGPCHKKKLICPAKCFSAYGRSGKGYGYGGGGGGCTIDCKKCTAFC